MNNNIPHYLIAFLVALSLHILTVEGVDYISQYKPAPIPVPVRKYKPLKMRFVDTYNKKNESPDKPTDMISDKSNRASQVSRPDKNLPDKQNPYLEKVSDSPRIKTALPPASTQITQPVVSQYCAEQSPRMDTPEQNVSEQESQEPVEKKVLQADKNQSVTRCATIEIPEPNKTSQTAQQKKLADKPKPSVPDQVMPSGTNTNHDISPLDGKIDELIHSASVDSQSVSKLIDQLKFNIRKNKLGEYYADMKRKISRNWKTRILTYSSDMFSSSAVIIFKITEDGNLGFIKCLEYKGNPFFSQDCIASIHDSLQFQPLPEEYIKKTGKKYLWVYITFGYNTGQ